MNLDEFKLLVTNNAKLSSRMSYGKIKRIFLIANELGFDDIKIQGLVSQLNNYYECQYDIHDIDIALMKTTEQVTIETLKTERYSKIKAIRSVMEEIPATVSQYLVISSG